MPNTPAPWPSELTVPVAWGDMDAFAHVNNVVYFRWFETGRIDYFRKIRFIEHLEADGVGPILAHTECRFRAPLTFPDQVTVRTRVSDVGVDRFVMRYEVISHRLGRVAAEGSGKIVCYDYRAGAKCPLPDALRARIEALETPAGGAG